MKLSALKIILQELNQVEFILPNGDKVPEHFHVTEIGKIEKTFNLLACWVPALQFQHDVWD